MSELKPCPFCGAGTTNVEPGTRVWMGTKYGEPATYSVRHWCDDPEGQPKRMIERIGRDRESAIAAWNRRAPASEGEQK
ncbi:Lar family restriction alleviation protein [Burkholderia cenocepacia]